jgi:hypothetical protein
MPPQRRASEHVHDVVLLDVMGAQQGLVLQRLRLVREPQVAHREPVALSHARHALDVLEQLFLRGELCS